MFNQVSVTYEKVSKKLLSVIKYDTLITNADIINIPSVSTVITQFNEGIIYIEDNEYYVDEDVLYGRK